MAKRMRSCEPCRFGLLSSRFFSWRSWPRTHGQDSAPATPLTLVSREGRRTVPTTLQNGREVVALDDVANLFQVSVKEDALAGGVTVSYRGRTIVAVGESADGLGGGTRRVAALAGHSGRTALARSDRVPVESRSPPFTTSASSSGERRGCWSSATCACRASPRSSTAPVHRRARRSRSLRPPPVAVNARTGTGAGTDRRRRPRPHAVSARRPHRPNPPRRSAEHVVVR